AARAIRARALTPRSRTLSLHIEGQRVRLHSSASSMNDTGPYVGRSLLRREDQRLLTGQGQFVSDLVLPRMLHAVFVRSQVAHARIRSVDVARAAAMPGVVLALAGAELLRLVPPVPGAQLSLPSKWRTQVQHTFHLPQQPLLAMDKVRHVG